MAKKTYKIFNGTNGNDIKVFPTVSSKSADAEIVNYNVKARAGDDNVTTGTGDDIMNGGEGNDTLDGGAGHDLISGGRGNDIIVGNDGNDTLVGGAGRDTLNGGNGNDIISGGVGKNSIDGGAGIDMVDYSDTYTLGLKDVGLVQREVDGVHLIVDLSQNYAIHAYDQNPKDKNGGFDLHTDTLENIENVTGTARNDRLLGDDRANRMLGGEGNDNIEGKAGNDMLDGGFGSDTVKGGAGDDVITGGRDQTQDLLFGGDGNDTITLYKRDIATGGSGRDVFVIEKFGSPENMIIKDFVTDVDKIDFRHISEADQFSDLKIEEHTDKMLVTVKGTGISIELSGVDMLTANDFMFYDPSEF